jgi:hypothetical protein
MDMEDPVMTRKGIMILAGMAGLALAGAVTPAAMAGAASSHPGRATASCARDAVGTLPAAVANDPRWISIWRANPASQAPGKDAVALDRSSAIAAAKIEGARGQMTAQLNAAPAAAVELPYGKAATMLGEDAGEGIVASNRCVWLVTVSAPFTPRSAPHGVKAPTFDAYTMAFDVATGQYLSTVAGPTAPNLVTGQNLISG